MRHQTNTSELAALKRQIKCHRPGLRNSVRIIPADRSKSKHQAPEEDLPQGPYAQPQPEIKRMPGAAHIASHLQESTRLTRLGAPPVLHLLL